MAASTRPDRKMKRGREQATGHVARRDPHRGGSRGLVAMDTSASGASRPVGFSTTTNCNSANRPFGCSLSGTVSALRSCFRPMHDSWSRSMTAIFTSSTWTPAS
jgi:hypothetical protein